jgi:hypothetical protein
VGQCHACRIRILFKIRSHLLMRAALTSSKGGSGGFAFHAWFSCLR